jgi:hypothetical protein
MLSRMILTIDIVMLVSGIISSTLYLWLKVLRVKGLVRLLTRLLRVNYWAFGSDGMNNKSDLGKP